MSLATDKFFKTALAANSTLMTSVGNRLYNTVDDEIGEDTTPLPYLLICNDGTVNDESSKDEPFEGDCDRDTIRITVCHNTRSDLATLATSVRDVILAAARSLTAAQQQTLGFYLDDYQFSASAVAFDDTKPCYWQDLIYVCQTTKYS